MSDHKQTRLIWMDSGSAPYLDTYSIEMAGKTVIIESAAAQPNVGDQIVRMIHDREAQYFDVLNVTTVPQGEDKYYFQLRVQPRSNDSTSTWNSQRRVLHPSLHKINEIASAQFGVGIGGMLSHVKTLNSESTQSLDIQISDLVQLKHILLSLDVNPVRKANAIANVQRLLSDPLIISLLDECKECHPSADDIA